MYGADTYGGGDNVNNRETTFKITSTKLYFPIVTLSTKGNVNLTKQLNEGFKRSFYWNEYKSKIETKEADANNLKRVPLRIQFRVTSSGATVDGLSLFCCYCCCLFVYLFVFPFNCWFFFLF